jgi:hypothetical protein
MNITTNVNETLRRGAKKKFYVALVICAMGWAQGTSFPQAPQTSVDPQSPAASPAPGRAILMRFVWSDITPDSHHVEQSFSDDGGKTWEPNFVATLTRESK